jgi:hypothetical protein
MTKVRAASGEHDKVQPTTSAKASVVKKPGTMIDD